MAKSLLAFIFAFSNAFAISPKSQKISVDPDQVIINPSTLNIGEFLLGYKDYSDLRIDSDLDGKVDYWVLRKGPLEVATRYVRGEVSYIKIKKYLPSSIREAIYTPDSRGHLKLMLAKDRKNLVMHGEADAFDDVGSAALMCSFKISNVDLIKKFTQSLAPGQVVNNILRSKYIDSSCSDDQADILANALKIVITKELGGFGTSDHSNTIFGCLQDPSNKLFSPADNEQVLNVKSTATQYLNTMSNLGSGNKSMQGLFACSTDDVPKLTGQYEEGKQIKISFPKNFFNQTLEGQQSSLKRLLLHEFLHQSGIKEDAEVEKILEVCDKKHEASGGANVNANPTLKKDGQDAVNESAAKADSTDIKNITDGKMQLRMRHVDKSEVTDSLNKSAGTQVDLTKEIATAAPIPSAETLAQTNVQKTPEGISEAVNDSYAQGAPVLRMANQVMGTVNTPALADTTTYESSSDSSNSYSASSDSYTSGSSYHSSSSNDSTSSSSPSRNIASSSTARVANITSRNTLKADEHVVEQVDLSNSNPSPAPIAATSTDNGSSTTSGAATTRTNDAAIARRANSVSRTPASGTGEIAAMSTSNPSVGSLSTNTESSSPNPQAQSARAASTGRRPASTASSSGGNSSNGTSKDEVVTFFSNANYETSKSKLKDPTFINNLKTNKVTIVDLYGNSYGADKGDVIFLDEGNRFVRQK